MGSGSASFRRPCPAPDGERSGGVAQLRIHVTSSPPPPRTPPHPFDPKMSQKKKAKRVCQSLFAFFPSPKNDEKSLPPLPSLVVRICSSDVVFRVFRRVKSNARWLTDHARALSASCASTDYRRRCSSPHSQCARSLCSLPAPLFTGLFWCCIILPFLLFSSPRCAGDSLSKKCFASSGALAP